MISYLLPTRNRPGALARTLEALGALPAADHRPLGGAEVIVVENASDASITVPARLGNGIPVRLLRLDRNEGAAARNAGARAAEGLWLVMLDDDSCPLDTGHLDVLAEAPDDVAAVGAEILLPGGGREAGGLPEVFVGCGAAVRRDAFVAAGGYDPTFGFYAEEYDLCAKLLMAGRRIVHDTRFRVMHHKVAAGRDMDVIVRNLVRNNGWVMQRYAPAHRRQRELSEVIARYGRVAIREQAAAGFAAGVAELLRTPQREVGGAMSEAVFDRFTGRAHARAALGRDRRLGPGARVAIVDAGKNEHIVREVLGEIGVKPVADEDLADVLVVGTLSPGPMLDAIERRSSDTRPVIGAWSEEEFVTQRTERKFPEEGIQPWSAAEGRGEKTQACG